MAGKGNNGNHGKKGRSGRKSAYQEMADAREINKAFFEGVDSGKLKKLIEDIKQGKKIKLFDYMLLRSLKSDRILSELMRKVFPDKIESKNDITGLAEALKSVAAEVAIPQLPEKPDK